MKWIVRKHPLTPALSPRGEGEGCGPAIGAKDISASSLPSGRETE